MKAQFVFLLRVLLQYQNQLVIVYFCLVALSWKYYAKLSPLSTFTYFIGTAGTLAALTIFAYTLVITVYLLYPNYFDPGLPEVASISWLWMRGHELYPDSATGDVYFPIYGPLTYLVNGIALLLGPSIFVSKLPGVLSLGVALAATWILLKRTTGSAITSLLLLGSVVMLFDTFDVIPYWNRPEPFLIFLSVLALLILSSKLSPLVEGIGIGVLAGLATGLKLHGFIYLVPAGAAVLAKVETWRGRFITAIVGSLCAAASALLLYLEKGVSIISYLPYLLRVILDQRWFTSLFIDNVHFLFVFTVPIIVIWIWQKSPLNPSDRWLFIGLCFSAATVAVIGAKHGAGSYYLLPLVPFFAYGLAALLATSKEEIATLLFVSFLLAYGPSLLRHIRGLYLYQISAPWIMASPELERNKITELKTYLHSYTDAQIGVSDLQHYSSYFYRVFSVWNGRPLQIDFTGWMFLSYVGVDEEHVLRFIKACAVQTWILPLGKPFWLINLYTAAPMLSDNFRQIFLANYRQVSVGQAYQVWQCNPKPK
jgi:hypothetical protein